MKEIKGLITIT